MQINIFIVLLFLGSCSCSFTAGFITVGVGSFLAGWHMTKCYFGACCKESWYEHDFEAMKTSFHKKLYGQHIAEEIVYRHLKAHFLNSDPKKALVLSLHGTTGSGKNYITSIAVAHLLVNGMKSPHVKVWNAKQHFSDDKMLQDHEREIRQTIKTAVSSCARSIFIFDETNELPAGLLDVLKPMMDEYAELDGVDYRKSTFLFLSNTGAKEINRVTKKFKDAQKPRSELKLRDFQPLIQKGAFKEKGGLMQCALIDKSLIDSYVPFLPMEKEHIKMCIRYFLERRHCRYTEEFVDKLASNPSYEPDGYNYYAPYGCRGVDNLIIQESDDNCIFNTPKSEF